MICILEAGKPLYNEEVQVTLRLEKDRVVKGIRSESGRIQVKAYISKTPNAEYWLSKLYYRLIGFEIKYEGEE